MIEKKLQSTMRRPFDRRAFLKACGIFGIGAAGGGTLQALFEVVKIGRGLVSVSHTRVAMGTYVTITAVDASRDRADEAIGRSFDEMDRLIAILSRHDASTPLSMLNSEGVLREPPPELVHVIRRSIDIHGTSRGAFDITVKPVVDLLRSKLGAGGVPTSGELRDSLAFVGMHHVETTDRRIRLLKPGAGITLDGIAKGYVVDRVSEVLVRHGVENHLVNAGGDIRTRGHRSDGRPWSVAVEDPEKKRRYPEMLRLNTGAVATSGSYEVYYDRERVYHHLVDPRSGRSPHYSKSVTVIAGSVMEADALATAVFVMGPGSGRTLIDATPSAECLLLGENGKRHRSAGWRGAV
ncbi:MAG: FAD:protein FMN transferase [Candidatus Krumholzibacteriia bacterium]